MIKLGMTQFKVVEKHELLFILLIYYEIMCIWTVHKYNFRFKI